MYCRNCGAELKEGQKFCTKCGAPITSAPNTETKSAEPENADSNPTKDTTPKKMNTRVIAGIIAAVAVVAVIIIVVATRSGGSEEQVAETGPEPEQVEETAQSEYEDEYAEDEESGLTAGEQEQLRQQEIIDNIELDLTIKEGQFYDSIDIWSRKSDFDPEDLYYVSGTITNNNDEDYCFTLKYNIEQTYIDNYGDKQTEEIEPYRSDEEVWVTAHETVPYYEKWSRYLEEEDASYVCTGVEVDLGTSGYISTTPSSIRDGKLIPISEVSDIRLALYVDEDGDQRQWFIGDGYSSESCAEFSITNNTDDRWSEVIIDYYILLNGEYMERCACVGEYIKPGETVQIEDHGDSNDSSSNVYLPDEMYNSDGSVVDEIEVQVCGVAYVPDTSE